MEEYILSAEEQDIGLRIDKYLIGKLTKKSRSFIQNIIEDGHCKVNDKVIKNSYKLRKGDNIKIIIPEPEVLQVNAEDIPIDIMYEDSDVIVVNKPQGMVVHPAAGNYTGTLVNAILNHCKDLSGINGVIRPGIVHRIDKDTSGVLVIAKNDFAHIELSKQLKEHSMKRVYNAIVEGIIKNDDGTVDAPLARNPQDRKKIAVVKDGRRAVTHYKVIDRFKNTSFIECRLETGRTHQIRVHMAYIGHPLVGDPVYGFKKQRFNLEGQALHAKILGFIHPTTRKYMEFESPLPNYFQKIINVLKNELK
ncbi:RluA family pseudouridine synthase [Clostridium oryzae]|uniref:Pseudouridine synthase n=1 Tax=Clostridium oryzae TaxID=1450648 RepID=A0A1V4IUY2_9CLOT|nr:RluA family pseudouridine synthase [Clostridium oryzae]OPJ63227.1 ribosomal large subunit pseudouridine synthase D [Clostridium oryzae]